MITPRPVDAEPVEPTAAIPLVALARLPHVQTAPFSTLEVPMPEVPTAEIAKPQPATLAMPAELAEHEGERFATEKTPPPAAASLAALSAATPSAEPLVFNKIVEAACEAEPPHGNAGALPARVLKLQELLAPYSGLIMAAAVMLAALTLGWLNVAEGPVANEYRSSGERRQAAWKQDSPRNETMEATHPRNEAAPDFDTLVKNELANDQPRISALVRLGEPVPGNLAPMKLPTTVGAFPSTGMSDKLPGMPPLEPSTVDQTPIHSSEPAAKLAQRPGEEAR